MESQQIDNIARALAGGTSRRGLVRRLAGGATGGLVALVGERALAKKPEKPPHRGPRDCCPKETPRLCQGVGCVDFFTDPNHCGGCAVACAAGQSCLDGVCTGGPECTSDADCDDGNPCTSDTCEATTGECVFAPAPGVECTTVEGLPGICDDAGACAATGHCVPGEQRSCGSRIGACVPGTETCQADGAWGPCEGGVGPRPEICNGRDDDCNGMTDDGATCQRPDEVCDGGRCCVPSDVTTEDRDCGRCCRGDCRTFTFICE